MFERKSDPLMPESTPPRAFHRTTVNFHRVDQYLLWVGQECHGVM
jgi:hypothetical protein